MSIKAKYKEKTLGVVTLLKIMKGMFVSLIITFASIILFAFIIKWANLSDSIITPVNLVIKGVSILFGVLVVNKNSGKKLINGLVFSVLYSLVTFLVFSCLAGTLVIGFGLAVDFIFNCVVGAIASFLTALSKN